MKKTTKGSTILAIMLSLAAFVQGQVKTTPDTLECHIIGFSGGLKIPSTGTASEGAMGGNMKDLYEGPYLDFSIGCDYKYASNWMVSLDGDFWFGLSSDNLENRVERMGNIFTPTGYAMGWGGSDGIINAYNRGLSLRLGLSRIFTFLPNNPNSGFMLKVSGGWMMQKTVFSQEYTSDPVPQLKGDYAKLYDHLRNGFIISEGIGFIYMSNYYTYVNIRVLFEVSQCVSWSTRPYQIDNLMGLNGKDHNRYFDLLYNIKLSWMFPLTGKTTYDYYYY